MRHGRRARRGFSWTQHAVSYHRRVFHRSFGRRVELSLRFRNVSDGGGGGRVHALLARGVETLVGRVRPPGMSGGGTHVQILKHRRVQMDARVHAHLLHTTVSGRGILRHRSRRNAARAGATRGGGLRDGLHERREHLHLLSDARFRGRRKGHKRLLRSGSRRRPQPGKL